MVRRILAGLALMAVSVGTGWIVITSGANATAAPTGVRAAVSTFQQIACVKYGTPGSAAGNVMWYDWNDSACPVGTYEVKLAQPQPEPTATVTATPSPSPSKTVTATASP